MKQQTLAMAADQNNGFEQSRKPTRREEFLRTMETIVPWAALCQVIEPHYPKAGNGRPPIGLERMLRRRLQKGEVQLEPVVGRQGSFDPRGHQQRGLPQGRNRFFLEHQEFLR